jgi:hypothetical protein
MGSSAAPVTACHRGTLPGPCMKLFALPGSLFCACLRDCSPFNARTTIWDCVRLVVLAGVLWVSRARARTINWGCVRLCFWLALCGSRMPREPFAYIGRP